MQKDLIYKLKRIMERRRAELRIELSAKQKTKLRNDNHSDPTKCSQVAIGKHSTFFLNLSL